MTPSGRRDLRDAGCCPRPPSATTSSGLHPLVYCHEPGSLANPQSCFAASFACRFACHRARASPGFFPGGAVCNADSSLAMISLNAATKVFISTRFLFIGPRNRSSGRGVHPSWPKAWALRATTESGKEGTPTLPAHELVLRIFGRGYAPATANATLRVSTNPDFRAINAGTHVVAL